MSAVRSSIPRSTSNVTNTITQKKSLRLNKINVKSKVVRPTKPVKGRKLHTGGDTTQDDAGSESDIFRGSTQGEIIKEVKRASGWAVYDKSIRLGPQIIYENVERTPLPLWIGGILVDYKQVLEKNSTEIIPLTPQVVQSTTDLFYQGILGQSLRSPALSWNASLTDFEEEEFLAEAAYIENVKLAYCLPLETESSTKYESHEAHNILQPDGCFEIKERVRVILTETETVFTIQISGKCVEEESPEYEKVKANNDRYDRIVQHHLESDAYSNRSTQTFLDRERDKYTQLKGVEVVDASQITNRFVMLDEFNRIKEIEAKRKIKEEEDAVMKSIMDKVQEEVANHEYHGSSDDDDDSDKEFRPPVSSKVDWARLDEEDEADDEEPPDDIHEDELEMTSEDEFDIETLLDDVYKKRDEKARNQRPKILPNITKSSALMERILSTNRYQLRHMDIRGFDPIIKKEKEHRIFTSTALSKATALVERGPKLKRYWSYTSALVKTQEITCLVVHPTNGNLIAASYGGTSFANPPPGLVCIWNLKSINYPERIYKFDISATALAFSLLTPYLLAIGLLDGNVVVYDIRQAEPTPVSSTLKSQDKHYGPVWDLYWLQETEMASTGTVIETLVSLSDDGFLYRWNSSKGFDPTVMLKIRRSPLKIPGRRERRAEALISQLSASYTVCFYPDDSSQYLIGTEEGFIHKATASYSEQYIGTYIGHTGPVYAIRFSPFAKDIFISCGADWCVKIWKEDLPTCLLTVNTGLRTVFDVSWSPTMSAVFVCTTEINVEVWDLTVNTLEPLIQYKPPFSIGLRRVCFWDYMRGLVIGDDDGGITVYALRNFPIQPVSQEDQVDQLLGALIPGYKKNLQKEEEGAEMDETDDTNIDQLASEMSVANSTVPESSSPKVSKVDISEEDGRLKSLALTSLIPA